MAVSAANDRTSQLGASQLGVREFRENLTGVLRQARQGASFLITSHGEVVAELHPPASPAPVARKPGALRGRITMAADFDTLADDVLEAMLGAPA
jgi:prevent-host-death family protein